jgi:hypothetical protein
VSVGGRITDQYGVGLPRTMVTMFNTSTLESRTILSNSFGYYRFHNLEVGSIYVISVRNKRYSFDANQKSFSLNDAIENLDFVGAAQ